LLLFVLFLMVVDNGLMCNGNEALMCDVKNSC
jgi:hypothetical protein